MYSIKQLSSKCQVSIQSIYNLKSKNQSFYQLVSSNSVKHGKQIMYDEAVLNWLLNYYGGKKSPLNDDDTGYKAFTASEAVNPINYPPANTEALEGQIKTLQTQLAAAEQERASLIQQNAQLLLLLQEEKQEKMLLLETSKKKSLIERLKGFFHK